jgi:hypothetical protein
MINDHGGVQLMVPRRPGLFLVLAFVHLVILVPVLGEGLDRAIAAVAGVAYLLLAFAAWRSRSRRPVRRS